MPMSLKLREFITFLLLLFFVVSRPVMAAPVQISTCSNYGCTMGTPRHKVFASKTEPNTLWILHSNPGTLLKSTDGGASWGSPVTIGNSDFHISLSGDELGNTYVGGPSTSGSGSAWFRKINYPGTSSANMNPAQSLTSSYIGSADTRVSVLAQSSSDIWVFYRTSNSATGTVRYFRSRDGGLTFPEEGWVKNIGSTDVRIGSFMLGNNPAVYVFIIDPHNNPDFPANTRHIYFVWNGTQFVQNPDAVIVDSGEGSMNRHHNMLYANGELHLVYEQSDKLRHKWKAYNNGQGAWNSVVIEDLAFTPAGTDVLGSLWFPTLSAKGSEMHLFYTMHESNSTDNTNVYHRSWNSASHSWSNRLPITTDGSQNYYATSSEYVLPSSGFVPVLWSKNSWGTNSNTKVMFDKVGAGAGDQSAPAAPRNVSIQ